MLFLVRMKVDWPYDLPADKAEKLVKNERAYAAQLQQDGYWLHLWREVGQHSNVSIFSVPDHETLHQLLTGLPFYQFLEIEVTALCVHPGSLAASTSQQLGVEPGEHHS